MSDADKALNAASHVELRLLDALLESRKTNALPEAEWLRATLNAVTMLWLRIAVNIGASPDPVVGNLRRAYAKDIYQVGLSANPALAVEVLGYHNTEHLVKLLHDDGRVEERHVRGSIDEQQAQIRAMFTSKNYLNRVRLARGTWLYFVTDLGPINLEATKLLRKVQPAREPVRGLAVLSAPDVE